jgi:hypothetical protein
MIKYLLTIMLLASLITSCDKPYVDCEYPDYSNCITEEPENGKIIIKLSINALNKAIPVTIYNGRIENNVVYFTDTVYVSSKEYIVPANNYYSVKAVYKSGNTIINAIDGAYIEKKQYAVCDSICWVVKDVALNLKLKY